ncbi:MAG TPA: FtsK/SpoIIIE domain-containing protein, partial [Verrucomicrobiaceae bacterium]
LNEHIEKVIQMYLRNEYATITEYNAQAGSVAEKYHFLVVADFPANFGETAAKRLQSIAASGPRCGVFLLMHWDRRLAMPDGVVPDELRRNSVCLRREGNAFVVGREQSEAGATLKFEPVPNEELAAGLIHKIGKVSIDSNRVEVPFAQISPKPSERWTGDTTSELKIAIGRTGATKQQYLAIGKGTRQHALFAGKTGSGKSTLFHVIITNLALACSPDQVEFYLIDFKKGVEFKCYATHRLPHARVVAIESDREFGLSVLQRVDEELKRRGDMFRKLGVQDIAGYKKAGGKEAIPRTLLIIDEFQEFYTEDDQIAQNASVLFDRIVRQGRAFGIHVLLGSQTLGGAYTLARATLGQMVIRVALQCNEADSYLIMDENNSAPRLLSRPGEGIYNDAAGALEGNSPFQVVWLGDDERDVYLEQVRELADERHDRHASPIVFEGNAPAEIRENSVLAQALETKPAHPPVAGHCWLGAPNSIKGPTEAGFHRQSGNNLLIVGQREEAVITMMGLSLIALAAEYPVGAAKFFFFHSAASGTPDADFLEGIFRTVPHGVTIVRSHEVGEVMNQLSAELKERSAGDSSQAPAIFVFVHGLQKFKKLKQEDEFSFSSGDDGGGNPGAQMGTLVDEGAALGMHLIIAVDTFNNVGRFLSRKALTEFEMRVVFQMSANDSASLIDSPKAQGLGLHRALLFNEHEGQLETFRPYAMPDAAWLADAAQKLSGSAK